MIGLDYTERRKNFDNTFVSRVREPSDVGRRVGETAPRSGRDARGVEPNAARASASLDASLERDRVRRGGGSRGDATRLSSRRRGNRKKAARHAP